MRNLPSFRPSSPPATRPSTTRCGAAQPLELPGIAQLAAHASQLDALDRALRQALPAYLRSQTRLANVRGRRLIFLAPTPAWASRLRTQQQLLFNAAAALALEVDMLSIKIAPIPQLTTPEPASPAALSAASATHLRQVAAHLNDPELAQLFVQLAAHGTSAANKAP